MDEARSGYSRDGYIIDQARLINVPYGCRTSDYNGCGWIAAYNFLRCTGRTADEAEIRQALSRHSLFRGLLGTSPLKLRRYLKARGYPIRVALGKAHAIQAATAAGAGIVLYRHSNGWHFVAFTRAGDAGVFHFFNACAGRERHLAPMAAFLAENSLSRAVGLLWIPKAQGAGSGETHAITSDRDVS